MSKFVVMVLFMINSIVVFAEADMDSSEFLKMVRMPPGRESWALMKGKAMHRRSGSKTTSAPISFGVKFSPERTLAQVVIDNSEGYYVGQAYQASKDSTSIIPMKALEPGKKAILAEFGLRPEDLTMSFLYWGFVDELDTDSVKGQHCRVFLLKDDKTSEIVKVYLSSEFYFPLKVQWYGQAYVVDEELRTLEISSFDKKDNFWLIDSLQLFGEGWKTRVDFDNSKAGYSKGEKANIPQDLFIELK